MYWGVLIRCAARKVVCDRALQRTPAVYSGEREKLLRRLIHTEQPCAKLSTRHHEDDEYIMQKIKSKKEQMYNMLTEVQRNNNISRWNKEHNRQLLQQLSGQIEPKPNDRTWRWYRGSKIFDDCLRFIGVVVFFYSSIHLVKEAKNVALGEDDMPKR
ncbi:hypothetical protein ACQ4PT_038870 [Festuca glaucescens]